MCESFAAFSSHAQSFSNIQIRRVVISLVICVSLPVLNIVLTFQNPNLVFVLVLRAPSLAATASCWLSLPLVILAREG